MSKATKIICLVLAILFILSIVLIPVMSLAEGNDRPCISTVCSVDTASACRTADAPLQPAHSAD